MKRSTNEARVPGLKYTTKLRSKASGVVDRIILTLSGTDSAVLTKLSNRYKKLDNVLKKLQDERDALNLQLSDTTADLFDAEDRFYTRVIETVSLTMTLKKESEDLGTPEQTIVDYETAAKDILELLEGDLLVRAQEILRLHTVTIPAVLPDPTAQKKKPGFSVKVKDDAKIKVSESEVLMEENTKLRQLGHKYLELMNKWSVSYDRKLYKIKQELR